MSLKVLVQLNGTAVEDLLEARLDALTAIQAAMRALEKTAPHGRDYQHDRTGIMHTIARNDYANRFAQLVIINNELTEEIQDLDAQRTERATQKGGQ